MVWFLGYYMHKFIYINSKSTVRNTVDYSGQDNFFWKVHLCTDRTRHQGVPRIGTMQNTHLHCGLFEGEESTVRDQARTIRPQARTVRSLKN
jgi:hypothetical protein